MLSFIVALRLESPSFVRKLLHILELLRLNLVKVLRNIQLLVFQVAYFHQRLILQFVFVVSFSIRYFELFAVAHH